MYRIRDLQFSDKPYFAEGEVFKTKQEACDQLISYHEIDCDMSQEQRLLNKGKIDECWEALRDFEWELELINN